MSAVLWVLALVTVFLGLLQAPIEAFMANAIGAEQSMAATHHGWLPVAACLLAVIAMGIAWLEFGRRQSAQVGFVERVPALAALFGQRWYIDHAYRFLLDKLIYQGISRLFTWNDRRVIDGAVDGLGGSTIALGKVVARLHTGMIQHRLMVMFAVVIILVLYFGFGAS
jgi:NADH-quinone oxidoreductase subunit L